MLSIKIVRLLFQTCDHDVGGAECGLWNQSIQIQFLTLQLTSWVKKKVT